MRYVVQCKVAFGGATIYAVCEAKNNLIVCQCEIEEVAEKIADLLDKDAQEEVAFREQLMN